MKITDPLKGDWTNPKKIKEWGDNSEPKILDPWREQINIYGSPAKTMITARLLFPSFVEHDGGVFLEMQFQEDRYCEWKEKLSDVIEIEKVMNHIHIYDLFGYADDATEDEFAETGQLIRRCWEITLSNTFQQYIFDVVFSNSDQDYGPTVSFSKIR